MLNSLAQIPYRQSIFAAFVLFVFGTSVVEIITEFAQGESMAAMTDDLTRFALSAVMVGMFIVEYRAQRLALGELRGQLKKARGQLAQIDEQSPKLASQYRAVMQKQFDAWRLTQSEQDVVIGLLKGLSFREIAELRQTREKTVRQQASSVYRKAGVGSRNELAAWFFEDMLDPPAQADSPPKRSQPTGRQKTKNGTPAYFAMTSGFGDPGYANFGTEEAIPRTRSPQIAWVLLVGGLNK